MEGKYELHRNEIGSVYVSRNGHAAKICNQTFGKGRMGLQADKIIQQGDGEGKKKLGLDKDENHVEPLQPPRSIPTQHQSLCLNKTTN